MKFLEEDAAFFEAGRRKKFLNKQETTEGEKETLNKLFEKSEYGGKSEKKSASKRVFFTSIGVPAISLQGQVFA